MILKKQPAAPKAKALIEFKAVAKGEDLYIEGWANKAVVDRGGDLIPPTAWDVTEFKKNPIIFFNHDRNTPIGKATDVKVTKEGLRIRVKLSNSKEAPIPYIRDLVNEGILKAFSVGFDPMDSDEKQADGTNVVHKAKLLETSVVTLPMNQESLFDVDATEKAMAGLPGGDMMRCKSLGEARTAVLKAKKTKGAWMAMQFQDKIAYAQSGVYGFDKKTALAKISELSGMGQDMVTEIMAGNVTPVPEPFLQAFSQVFMCHYGWLTSDAEYEKARLGEESPAATTEEKQDATKEAETGTEEAKAEATQAAPEALVLRVKALVVEGKSADDAVKTALVEHPDAVARETMAELFQAADAAVQEQKDATVALPTGATDETEYGSPDMTLQKSQLAMLGTLVTLTKELLAEMRGVNQKMGDVLTTKQADVVPPPAEVVPSTTTQPEPVAEAAKAARVAKIKESLDTFEKQLAALRGAANT